MKDVNIKGYFSLLGIIYFSFNKFTRFRAITFCYMLQSVLMCIKIPVQHFILFEIPLHTVILGLGEKGSWVTDDKLKYLTIFLQFLVPLGSDVSMIVMIQFMAQ